MTHPGNSLPYSARWPLAWSTFDPEVPGGVGGESSELYLTVVFTTLSATVDAVRKARDWARQLGARIQILAPYVVPYALPLHHPQADPSFALRPLCALCERERIETRIEIRLCRNACDCLLHSLAPQSIVLIGARERWRLFAFEKRWAKTVRRGGHHVFLIRQRGKARNAHFIQTQQHDY